MDTHKRTFLKTLSWRGVATVTTALVTYVMTSRVDYAITVGLGDTLVKFFIYYLHERIWTRTRYGQKEPEYEI